MFEVLRNKGAVYQEADDVMAKVAQMNIMNDKEIDNYEDEDDEDELDLSIDDLLDGIDEEDIERGSSEFEADVADYMNSRLVAMDIKEDAEIDEIDGILSTLEEDVLGEGCKDCNSADGTHGGNTESEQGESGSLKREVRDSKSDQPKVPHAEDEEVDVDDYDFSIEEDTLDEGVRDKFKEVKGKMKATKDAKKQMNADMKARNKQYEDDYIKTLGANRMPKNKDEADKVDKLIGDMQIDNKKTREAYKAKRREIWRGKKEELDMVDAFLDEGCDCNVADGSHDKESEQGESGSLKRELRATKQDQPKVPHDGENLWTIEPAKKNEGRTSGNKSAYAESNDINDIDDYDFSLEEDVMDESCLDKAKGVARRAKNATKGALEGCGKGNIKGLEKGYMKSGIEGAKGLVKGAKDGWNKKEELDMVDSFLDEGCKDCNSADGSHDKESEQGESGSLKRELRATLSDQPKVPHDKEDFWTIDPSKKDEGRQSVVKQVHEDEDFDLDEYDFSIDEGCCGKKEADKMGNATKGDKPLNEEEVDESVDFEKISEPARGLARKVIGVAGNVNDAVSDKARKPVEEDAEDFDLDEYDFSIEEDTLDEANIVKKTGNAVAGSLKGNIDGIIDGAKNGMKKHGVPGAMIGMYKGGWKGFAKGAKDGWNKEDADMIDAYLDGEFDEQLDEERLSVQASSKRISDNVAAGTAIVPPGDVKDLTNDVERGPQRHEDFDLSEAELDELLYESEIMCESELFQNDGDNVNTWRDTDKIDASKDPMMDDEEDDLDDELLDI